jgi:hypothetical protein
VRFGPTAVEEVESLSRGGVNADSLPARKSNFWASGRPRNCRPAIREETLILTSQ